MTGSRKSQITSAQQGLLKRLPGVDFVLDTISAKGLFPATPQTVVTAAVRDVIKQLREDILDHPDQFAETRLAPTAVVEQVRGAVEKAMALNLDRLINATG